jgi:hypothetical protein
LGSPNSTKDSRNQVDVSGFDLDFYMPSVFHSEKKASFSFLHLIEREDITLERSLRECSSYEANVIGTPLKYSDNIK